MAGPPEPVALLVSMVVLQAAPWADCVQGPLQPVPFYYFFLLICSPEAGVKLKRQIASVLQYYFPGAVCSFKSTANQVSFQ